MQTWLPLLGGFVLLLAGGELLIRGAVQVAGRLGISPLVIGLTLVGFGTSTPELVTSVQAALSGSAGIAYGNIVGSNIANICLILGVSAVLAPVAISSRALKRDGLVMIGVAVTFSALAASFPMGRMAGAAFIALLVVYIYTAFRQERSPAPDQHGAVFDKSVAMEDADPMLSTTVPVSTSLARSLAIAVVGLGLVMGGGYFLVEGAVGLAREFGISETVIGLTVVAVGTSLPELATSVMAALRKQSDVAFGNIVGSNIYNILGIGGATALISPTRVPANIVEFDNLVMIVVSVLAFVLAFTGNRVSRWEGALLMTCYGTYVFWIWP